MKTVYWAFDEQLLEAALCDWIATAAPDNHPEARAAAESAAETVRSFLKGETAVRHKVRHEMDIMIRETPNLQRVEAQKR